MSDLSYMQTVAVEKTHIPALFPSGKDALAFFNTFYKEDFPDKRSRFLAGHSRNGYFEWMIGRILRTIPIGGLSFLLGQSSTQRILVADGYRELLISFITADDQLDSGIFGSMSLLRWAQEFPEKLANLAEGGAAGENVLNALNTASAQCNPNYEVPYGDDGDSLQYFFGCMTMLLTIFEYAKRHQMCVIHCIDKSVD